MFKNTVFNQSFFAMGTRCEVVLINTGQELAERTFQELKKEVDLLENLMSRFIWNSPLNCLNQEKAGIWIGMPQELWNIIEVCRDFYNKSGGVFDVTAGPLINLWKNRPDGSVPSESEIEQARETSGFDKIDFDEAGRKILKKRDGIEFDLGAIGKGIALDRMKSKLIDSGIKQAFISFGESSVLAMGTHPAGSYWPVGIPNALNPEEILHVFEASDMVVTTSGTLLNSSYRSASVRQHIINPVTGFPVNERKMVSVRSTSATLGEFLSTTFLILKGEEKNALLKKIKKIEILFINYKSDNDLEKEFIIL